jgi:hypothetical protein
MNNRGGYVNLGPTEATRYQTSICKTKIPDNNYKTKRNRPRIKSLYPMFEITIRNE